MDDTESILSRRLVRFGLIRGIWTIVGLFFTTQIYVSDYANNQPIRYGRPLLVQMSACYLWALATPLVPPVVAPSARSASMSSREPVRRERDAAGRERDARRAHGRDATDDRADDRAFRLLEAGGRPELALPRPPLLLTDGAGPANPELERLDAARLSC